MQKVLLIITCLIASLQSGYAQYDSLAHELDSLHHMSLRLRQKVRPTMKAYGFHSPQMDSLNHAIHTFDSASAVYVRQVIASHGWLGKSQVGETGNQALFLTVQYANDVAWLKEVLPLLQASAAIGESSLYDAALLEDRILVQSGQPQKYGTQYYFDEERDTFIFYPMEQEKAVNRRRRRIGLPRIQRYARQQGIVVPD